MPSLNLAIRFNPETNQRSLDALQWGLIPYWAKDPKIGYKTVNARVETVDTAPSYREAFKKRRCRAGSPLLLTSETAEQAEAVRTSSRICFEPSWNRDR